MASKSALERVQEAEKNHRQALAEVQQAHDYATKWSGIAEMARSELLQEQAEQLQQLAMMAEHATARAEAAEAARLEAVAECEALRLQLVGEPSLTGNGAPVPPAADLAATEAQTAPISLVGKRGT